MTVAGTATGGGAASGALRAPYFTVAQLDATVGWPDAETYPGPVTTDHSGGPVTDPGRAGPLAGMPSPPGFPGQVYEPDLSGGQITDTAALLGHSGEVAAFDSSAGPPFAPSGVLAPVHQLDTGGTGRTEHVPMPRSPGWYRRTLSLPTFNRQAQVTDDAGWDQNTVNARTDLDQYQGQNANAYDPAVIPYSERPIKANFAAEAYPVDKTLSVYAPDGALRYAAPMGGQGNLVYASPPDPAVNVQPPQQAAPVYQALGMEYVSG